MAGREDDHVTRWVKYKVEYPCDWGCVCLSGAGRVSGQICSSLPLYVVLLGGKLPPTLPVEAKTAKIPNVMVSGECEAQSRR